MRVALRAVAVVLGLAAPATLLAAPSISSATVDGGSSTTVAPGASITVSLTVAGISGGANTWKGTEWRISTTAPGATTCADTDDFSSGTQTASFTATAPGSAGTYNLYLIARQNGACTGTTSPTFTLSNAVTVQVAAICGNNIVESGEACDGGACCTNSCQFASSATVCRAAAGACDIAESCTGSTATCPGDGFVSSATVCRASAGPCDLAESCTGSAAGCPSDGFLSSATVCRPAAGACDVAESCTGSGAACPGNLFAASGTACGGSDVACDALDTCDGGGNCVDNVDPVGTLCLAGDGTCDPDDTCDGTSKTCAPNFAASGTACGDPTDTTCNAADTCNGSGSCLDNLAAEFTECGNAGDGICDLQDSCDDGGNCVDRVEPTTTTCDDGNQCTSTSTAAGDADYCDGAGACDIEFVVAGGACGDGSTTECTLPDTCDGGGTCLYNNQPCGVLTDGGRCAFDVEPDKGTCSGGAADGAACSLSTAGACETGGGVCEASDQFRLSFSPDVLNWVAYKLNASNPGQFFYNAIYDASTATDGVTLSFVVPYPFVTQGAAPLHVYDADAVPSDGSHGCLEPQSALAEGHRQILLSDWIDGTSTPDLVCDQVDQWGESGTCTLSVTIAQTVIDATANGQLYVDLHLDFGLKGPHVDADSDGNDDRYDRAGYISPWGSSDALVDTDTNDGEVAIADCRSFEFSHGDEGGTLFSADAENLNLFKKIAGAFGRVSCGDTGDAIGGTMKLYRLGTGGPTLVFGPTSIDADGFYALAFQHKGKAAQFAIEWCGGGDCHWTEPFYLQSNGWSNVDLVAIDGCDQLDGATATSDWTAIAPLYGAGKFKNN